MSFKCRGVFASRGIGNVALSLTARASLKALMGWGMRAGQRSLSLAKEGGHPCSLLGLPGGAFPAALPRGGVIANSFSAWKVHDAIYPAVMFLCQQSLDLLLIKPMPLDSVCIDHDLESTAPHF